MSSRFLSLLLVAASAAFGADGRALRVCADPDNLPFSNGRGEGFENRLAELMAGALGAKVEYTWAEQRRGFVRNTLNAGECDVIMGIPASSDMVATTRPYYRSSYVFVSRKPDVRSFDDPRLKGYRIGLQMAGEDYTPPAYELAARGLAGNVVGFSSRQPAAIIDAVARGTIDLAIVWGPLAGYYGRDLELAPAPPPQVEGVTFAFDLAMGVRKSDGALRDELDRAIGAQCGAIEKLLDEYRVPREGSTCDSPRLRSSASR